MSNDMIRVHFEDVRVHIPVALLQRGLAAQMFGFMGNANADPRAKALKLAFKVPARMLLGYAEWRASRGDAFPPVDQAQVKANVLEYAVTYFSSMILDAVAEVDWVAQYDVAQDGEELEITGMAAAAPSGYAAAGGASSSAETAGGADQGEPGGTLVPGGHVGQRENDIRQASDSGVAQALS